MFPTHVGIARPPANVAASTLRCSLRMWGLRDGQPALQVGVDMFPTHVGIARPQAHDAGPRGHVPYACGDCARWAVKELRYN